MNIAVSQPAVAQDDRIAWIELSSIKLPLDRPISDAKVLTGRQTR